MNITNLSVSYGDNTSLVISIKLPLPKIETKFKGNLELWLNKSTAFPTILNQAQIN